MKTLIVFVASLLLFVGCAYTPENQIRRAVERSDAKKTTAQLKLRHAQLERETGGSHFEWGGAYGDRQAKVREMERIERELMRRYKSGDQEAFLPIFAR